MNEEQARRIGERLRSARRQRGMSLRNLAGLAGVSVGYLSMVENGQRLLDRSSLITSFAEVLQIAPSELTGQPFAPVDPHTSAAHPRQRRGEEHRGVPHRPAVARPRRAGPARSGPPHRPAALTGNISLPRLST